MIRLLKSENYVTKEERKFDLWFEALQKALGCDLEDDGLAWALFKDGCDLTDAIIEFTT